MPGKKILFLCDGSDTDIVYKSFADSEDYEITVETTEKILDYAVQPYLERTIDLINEYPEMYDGVVGTHDSSAVFAAIICSETGKTFASLPSIINCQNKYISRHKQREVLPQAVPDFCLALEYLQNPSRLSPPFFIKPVRANISFGTHLIETPEELEYYIGLESKDIAAYNQYYLDALSLRPHMSNGLNVATCNSFLCEALITGEQVTVDGFVCNGEVHIFGMTKAVFYPGSNSFSHHEFPYSFSPALDEKINTGLGRLVPALGIDNSFFNVELRADPEKETFDILEVNSRIAFQFAKTIELVTGFDPLHLLCDVACNEQPDLSRTQRTTYPLCLNFELHSFTDRKIVKTPTQSGYEQIRLLYPDVHIRNLVHEQSMLSDYKHNPESFRYCMLDIPGNSREEILAAFEHITSLLGYEFEDL
ncbi:MAG: ATP-grasp domain-containing protein [Desulfovermiculus sp.]